MLITSKTKVVIFSRGKIRKIQIFTFENYIVEVVDEYVFLGTTFNYNNKFRKAQDKQLNQARRAMYSLQCPKRTNSICQLTFL